MRFSILIPHYKVGKITAYSIAQLLKYKGKHEIDILVVDNNAGDGSSDYLKPFIKDIKYQPYPKDMMQSHGIAFDYILPYVNTEWFITMESDSFPTKENWLDYYEDLINKGYDGAGSVLKLSGGTYMHPAGALYRKSIWKDAKIYCNNVEYAYFPNVAYRDGFASHAMFHKSIVEDVIKTPLDYVELTEQYKGLDRPRWVTILMRYSPVVAPFHNGMGKNNESVKTYGLRTPESEIKNVLLDNKQKIVYRVGAEPGQWLHWFQLAKGKKLFNIPTEVAWLPNRENEQQERTVMENGFVHLWGISAYHDFNPEGSEDISKIKQSLPDQLYNSLPEHQKIKI